MDNRYAVICAANEGNSGMVSVDAAAVQFLESHRADYSLFTAQQTAGKMDTYTLLSDWHQLNEYTHVLYWGDFLNSPLYGYKSFPSRSKRWGLARRNREAIDQWRKLFIPSAIGSHQQLHAIGQNFQNYFEDPKNEEAFTRVFGALESGFSSVTVRDPFSYQNLSRQFSFENLAKIRQGIDCAFLQDAPIATNEAGGTGTFAYYFRRSKLKDPAALVAQIEKSTGLRGVPLEKWIPLPAGRWEEHFTQLKGVINNAEFVLSDTYHVCVNAMQSRVPVVGVGRAQKRQESTIGDFKKGVLFDMFDLSRFYVEIPEGGQEEEHLSEIPQVINEALAEHAQKNPYALVEAKTQQFRRDLETRLGLTPATV